jgi:hypothetical protein
VSELEGEVVQVLWNNPHVRFTVRVTNTVGPAALWTIETSSVSMLRQIGISRDSLVVNDRIKVAGNPARASVRQMFAHNVLLKDGKEVVLGPGAGLRWTKNQAAATLPTEGDKSAPNRGIYRVWSSVFTAGMLFPEDIHPNPAEVVKNYPLTPRTRSAFAAFDPVKDSPIQNCTAKGMPTIMEQPYPMEFVKQGDNILLRLEEYDTVRTIYVGAESSRRSRPASLLGNSTGRWEGRTLVVTTTGITWRHFNTVGIPLGTKTEIVERFTPTADGSRLDYSITVTDPEIFTKPLTLQKYWIWRPNVQVRPYECSTKD